jgi:general nucleoside transport system permease protein
VTTPFALAVLSSAAVSGTSLLYATLGELVGERAGIVNLGLEGVMLVGASVGVAVGSSTANPYAGIVAAALAGMGATLLFGYVVISRRANQLATGLTLLSFGYGVSALIGRPFIGASIAGLPRLSLAGIGAFDLLVWLVAPTAVLLWWLLFRTRWGLALRAVGEDPAAAFAAGRRPEVIQYQALALGGLLGGIGGAHLALGLALSWDEGMTAGRGFIAIALVIFAKWNPLWAILGALVFGGAESLQLQLQARGAEVSPFLMNMIPYLLTLLVLVIWGLRRRAAAPAGLGRNYFGVESAAGIR